jgi:ferredoxin-NADP reductase
VCGPPAMVAEMTAILAELGVAGSRIKTEEWS